MTTNGDFVWVPKHGEVLVLGKGPAITFPPGI